MLGVTEQEIAQAKQMNLYQYMQLCEPDNFKPEGPGQFRHKGHSSLTFAEDGSWTYFKTKATGRTALNYLIAVEGVSFVEAVREINRIQGGVRPSFQPVKTPPPPAEKKPAKEFRLPKPDKNNYAATAYLRKRCIHPNFRIGCYVAPEHPQPGDNLDKLQVYQITKGGCEYRFMNYAYSKSRIHAADYSSVYIANLPADYDLDRCFQEFNAPNRPLRYHMCSLSTSDIVVTTKNGKETAYYVDSIGFKDVSHLLPELHEVEAQRQKEKVQDEPER